MARFGSRIKESSDTTGTGDFDLNGAPTGFRAFADRFSDQDDEISYLIVDDPDNPTEFEFGKGTFVSGSPHTFQRDTVEGSSNSDNKVSFSAGTKTIIATPTEDDWEAIFGAGGWGTKSGLVRAITTDDNQVAADDGKVIDADASGNSPATLTYTLLAEATAGDGFVVTVRNDGATGTVDIDDDAAALVKRLRPDEAATYRCDGTKWHPIAELIRPGVLSVTDDYTITVHDNGKLILADGSGNSPAGLTLTFGDAATLGDDFGVDIRNIGASGDATLATSNSPADGIDGEDTLTLEPDESASVRGTGSTFYSIGAIEAPQALTLGTEQATTSGNGVEFTGIPAGTQRITLMFENVSLDDTDHYLVQIGDSGGYETTGYDSTTAVVAHSAATVATNRTDGFGIFSGSESLALSGKLVLDLKDAANNTWVATFTGERGTTAIVVAGGSKSLDGVLDRIQLLDTAGDAFDAGSVNISYE